MRKLMWFSVGFAGACLLGSYLFGTWLLGAAAATLALTGLLILWKSRKKFVNCIIGILLGLTIGFLWQGIYDRAIYSTARELDGVVASTVITATDYSYDTAYGSAVKGKVTVNDRAYSVKLYLRGHKALKPGDTVSSNFQFRTTLAGGEKKPNYQRSNGIFLFAYQRGEADITCCEEIPRIFLPTQWRHVLLGRIQELFPDDTAGFAKALLLGDRSGIDYKTKTDFKVSGISHIVAVSGLHVSILFAVIYTMAAHRRFLAGLLGIPLLFLFASMVGFTPSVTRACIMQSLMLISVMWDREYDPPTALSFAVLCILVYNPLESLSVSFQLSVCCMVGIFLFSGKIYDYLGKLRLFANAKGKSFFAGIKRWGMTSISVTVSANIMTTPLVACYFGTVSLVGIITNVLTLWVISFIFYGIMACILLSSLSMKIAAAGAWIVSWLIRYVTGVAGFLTKVPLAAVYTTSVYIVIWLVGVYCLIGVFLVFRKKHPAALICGIGFSLILAVSLSWLEPLTSECRLTALNVGQGQSVLLQSGGKSFLVDCGGDTDEKAADIAAETLLAQGISRLDGIILTHYDADHVGGVCNLLTRIDTDLILLPDIEDEKGLVEQLLTVAPGKISLVQENLTFTYGDTTMTVAGPEPGINGNESSLCVLFQTKNCDILITGDRGAAGEAALMHSVQLPKVDVLVAGHHGSATSTSEEFLSAVDPDIVIISAGLDNRFGHPSKAVLQRLEEHGCIVYRTDLWGTVTFRR